MAKTNLGLWGSLIIIVLFVTACTQPTVTIPEREVPVTEAAAQKVVERLAALKDLPNGEVKLTFTESEITSYLRLRVLKDRPLPIQDPTVWFSGGQVYVKGLAQLPPFSFQEEMILVLTVEVENNRLQITFRELFIAGIPFPQQVLERLNTLANERLSNTIGPVTLRDVQILEGEIIVVLTR